MSNNKSIDVGLVTRLTSEVSYFERGEGLEAVKRSKNNRGGAFEEECQATVVLAPNVCYLR